jgi:hypothetical protein
MGRCVNRRGKGGRKVRERKREREGEREREREGEGASEILSDHWRWGTVCAWRAGS